MAKVASAGMGNFLAVYYTDGGRKDIRKKLEKLKCLDKQIDDYFEAFDSNYASLNSGMTQIRMLITEKIKGADILVQLASKGQKKLGKLFATFVVAPQFIVLSAKFTADLHYNTGGKIEFFFKYERVKTLKFSV